VEESLLHRLFANSMLVEMPCFVLKFRYSGGKIIVTNVCHYVSDLTPSNIALPRGGAEINFEAHFYHMC